jgi:uncharacterized protein YyaL (SSP411 family)
MAEALLRLSHFTRDETWAAVARETLASFANDYKSYGHFVAGYARAVDLVLHPPVHVTIVGPREREDTRALQRAALAPTSRAAWCSSSIRARSANGSRRSACRTRTVLRAPTCTAAARATPRPPIRSVCRP